MEPSVEKFIHDFDKKVTDCDMPDPAAAQACKTQVHLFGLPPAAVSAEIEKKLDAVAAGAQAVADGECARIMTGAPLPPGADAVVQFEEVEDRGDEIYLWSVIDRGSSVRSAGQDVPLGA